MAQRKHFFLTNTASSESYTATGGGSGTFRSPPRDFRPAHGANLVAGFASAVATANELKASGDASFDGVSFVPIALEGNIGILDNKKLSGLDLDKLDSNPKDIRIVSVREEDDRHWAIGEFGQTKGSVHSDYWRGNAGQLADSGSIAIFPITGWWGERPNQGCVEKVARYSLIVTIRTQKAELEVYNWVANEVQIPTEIIVE